MRETARSAASRLVLRTLRSSGSVELTKLLQQFFVQLKIVKQDLA